MPQPTPVRLSSRSSADLRTRAPVPCRGSSPFQLRPSGLIKGSGSLPKGLVAGNSPRPPQVPPTGTGEASAHVLRVRGFFLRQRNAPLMVLSYPKLFGSPSFKIPAAIGAATDRDCDRCAATPGVTHLQRGARHLQ